MADAGVAIEVGRAAQCAAVEDTRVQFEAKQQG
jgi:hypothetical protein